MNSKSLLALPVALPAAMYAVFKVFSHLFAPKLAHLLGMATYWSLLLALCAISLGRTGLLRILKTARPARMLWILLALPVVLAFCFGPFRQRIAVVTPLVVTLSFVLAAINASLEEIFWRGVYIDRFADLWKGYIYPAVGFAVWHFAPQSILPYSHGRVAFVASALLLGLCWGIAAFRTKSVRWTVLSHLLVDFSGFGVLVYISK